MAIGSYQAGTATIGTSEYSLTGATTTGVPLIDGTNGFYQLFVDFSDMAAGDQFQVKLYERVNAVTQALSETWTFTGVQAKPIVAFPGLILIDGWDMTIKKLAGTDRSIRFDIRQVT